MKNTNPSIDNENKANQRSRDTDQECVYAWRAIPVSKAMVNAMCDELPGWPLKNPTAKTIREFYLSKGISRTTFRELRERHPRLKEAYDIAMGRIGERLWGRAVDKDAEWNAVKWMLHNYDQEFDEANKYHARLKAEADAAIEKGTGNKEYIVIYKDRPAENKNE